MTSLEISFYRTFFKPQRLKCSVTCFPRTWSHFPRTSHVIFRVSFSRTLKKNHFRHNVFFTSLIIFLNFQFRPRMYFTINTTACYTSQSNHINTMLPNEMVVAPLQKLQNKYELSYQSTTRLKYIDKFDQLLIIYQWPSTVDNTVRSLIHFTIFIWYYVVKHFPSFINKNHH